MPNIALLSGSKFFLRKRGVIAKFSRHAWALFAFVVAVRVNGAELKDLWPERVKCVVAVEFYIQGEIERHPVITQGTVIDHEGTIILAATAISGYLPPNELKDFRVYRAGGYTTNFGKAQYLGYDAAGGWHFIRVEPSFRSDLVPITDFAAKGKVPVELGEQVWGISVRSKDEDFAPVFWRSDVGFISHLPQATAFTSAYVSGPQLPVFNLAGEFVGLGVTGYGETFAQYSHSGLGSPLLLVSADRTHVFRMAEDVLPFLSRVPRNAFSRPSPWLGVMGLQTLQPDVAKFLHLEDQSALVISEVFDSGPAEKAGLKDHDVLIEWDGKPLPRLRPPQAVVTWLEREVALSAPGASHDVTVLRGNDRVNAKLVLGDEPKMLREAQRTYFDRLGITVREFLAIDAIANRVKLSESAGVVINFVKHNSPAASAGLRAEDWLQEIDGAEVKSYDDAVQKLSTIDKDQNRNEFVLLVSRGGETSVLRVKLR